MKCLNGQEISDKLRAIDQLEAPRDNLAPNHHLTFYAPSHYNYQAVECFLECYLNQIVERGELLLVITDAEPASPAQEFTMTAIRRSLGETRQINETPGYLVDFGNRHEIIALFSLITCFGWKGYLYSEVGQMTLFTWEGEIFDFWTALETKRDKALELLKGFHLEEVSK